MTISINSEEVYEAVREFVEDGRQVSFSELSDFIRSYFGANENQVSGLIFRMHAKKKILRKLEERGFYSKYIEPNLIEEIKTEANKLIEKTKEELGSKVLELSSEEIGKLKNFIKQLEDAKSEL
jgi:hypothetical protein